MLACFGCGGGPQRGTSGAWTSLGSSSTATDTASSGEAEGEGDSESSGSSGATLTTDASTTDPSTTGTEDTGIDVDPCEPIAGANYESISGIGPPTNPAAAVHGDINVALRGWGPTGGALELVDYGGDTDNLAPKLNTLFEDDQRPPILSNYAVNEWDWGCDCVGGPITAWEVTMVGLQTTPGQILELPASGYDIGGGRQARVLYADDDSITLKYTLEDDVVYGYAIHLVGLCVEPSLRERYEADNSGGRSVLPALNGDQPLGRARGTELLVTIRDTGSFMDPRAEKDWWN